MRVCLHVSDNGHKRTEPPEAGWDALGGSAFYSASVRLLSPLPRVVFQYVPLYVHTFFNAGKQKEKYKSS